MTGDLRRQLGLVAVMAVVAGDMMGSGIFYTPQELAPIAQQPWQVYFFWGLCGVITLCGALTAAELGTIFPRSGADYHIVREGFGGLAGFVKVWMSLWVSGPGSVAAVAILFGKFCSQLLGQSVSLSPVAWGVMAVLAFTVINLMGVKWGGRTQIALTGIKVVALLLLVFGSLMFAEVSSAPHIGAVTAKQSAGFWGFFRFMGLGVGAVLFTYDGWLDIVHVAGEVKSPGRNLPVGLTAGVGAILVLYLITNFAYLRIVPLGEMAGSESLAAVTVAEKTFGDAGGRFITLLMMISILGALGGLVMTFPRLLFAAGREYAGTEGVVRRIFQLLGSVSSKTRVPVGAIWVNATTSVLALLFFQSFSRIANFFVVPNQLFHILLVAAIFRFRRRDSGDDYQSPGYPIVPLVYILTIAVFLASALIYRPGDTLIGVALTATGIPAYRWLERRKR